MGNGTLLDIWWWRVCGSMCNYGDDGVICIAKVFPTCGRIYIDYTTNSVSGLGVQIGETLDEIKGSTEEGRTS